MRYAIYNESGEILRVLSCPPSCLDANIQDGQSACAMPEGDDSTHKVVDGQAVPKVA